MVGFNDAINQDVTVYQKVSDQSAPNLLDQVDSRAVGNPGGAHYAIYGEENFNLGSGLGGAGVDIGDVSANPSAVDLSLQPTVSGHVGVKPHQMKFYFSLRDRNGRPLKASNALLRPTDFTDNNILPKTRRDAFGQTGDAQVGDMPDLYLHVNPSNFERPLRKIVSREMTKNAWVEFHGGDDLDMITCSGASGGFFIPGRGFVGMNEPFYTPGTGAYTYVNRNESQGYQELMSMISLFRSNANTYDDRGLVYEAGFVILNYDGNQFAGQFETLTITESAEKPFHMEYSFTFLVEQTILRPVHRISSNSRAFGRNGL